MTMNPTKQGVSTTGHGPTRTVDDERCRVRYEGFDYWEGSSTKRDKWSSWFDRGDGQWLLDGRVCLPEGSTLEEAERRLL